MSFLRSERQKSPSAGGKLASHSERWRAFCGFCEESTGRDCRRVNGFRSPVWLPEAAETDTIRSPFLSWTFSEERERSSTQVSPTLSRLSPFGDPTSDTSLRVSNDSVTATTLDIGEQVIKRVIRPRFIYRFSPDA